jgi:hypothetical protein
MRKILATITICLLSVCSRAQFVHPGMLHNQADLQFLKAKVGEEPWKSAWETLQKAPEAQLSWKPEPHKVIVVGFYSKPDIGGTAFRNDGDAAYTLALRYTVTGDPAYAKKAAEIINVWSYTLDSVTDGNKKLLVGIAGIKFLNAAEILRHTYKGWESKDQQAFEKMIMTVWYPLLKDFMPGYNGNWDAAIAQTVMCIGIFTDRQDIFDLAYNQILKGESNGAIDNYFNEWGSVRKAAVTRGMRKWVLGL